MMARLALKIDREAGKNGINGLNFSKSPTPVHAKPAVGQHYQSFDVLAVKFSCRRHFLEFVSHN